MRQRAFGGLHAKSAQGSHNRLFRNDYFLVVGSRRDLGAYHLTLLNPLHATVLPFPISQFASGVVIGTIWGYVFIKRWFETTTRAHTLSAWLSMLFFM